MIATGASWPPATDSPPAKLRHIKNAIRRGARVITIDHRRSETARATRAEWIGIRPGRDGALALGIINVIIRAALYDRAFVGRWAHGFEELAHHVDEFTPDRVAAITVVPAESVVDLARAVGASLITAWPDPALWRRTLAALDLLVVVNRFPTADAEFADLLLPAATPFETASYQAHDGWAQIRSQLIEPRRWQ